MLEGRANNEQKLRILVTDKEDEHLSMQLQDKRRCIVIDERHVAGVMSSKHLIIKGRVKCKENQQRILGFIQHEDTYKRFSLLFYGERKSIARREA